MDFSLYPLSRTFKMYEMETTAKKNISTNLVLNNFKCIGLEEMNKAAFMKRVDHKFLLNQEQLEMLLPELSRSYYILEINNVLNHSYASLYFDTPDLDMYMSHHNKRQNRYKIRQRMYYTTGDSFLEIKYKNNRGYTKKTRTETKKMQELVPYKLFQFVTDNTPYLPFLLKPMLRNEFNRFTLTNRARNQRITIDTAISFYSENRELKLPNIAVIEVKSDKGAMDKNIFNLLKKQGIKPSGMSKYSIGLAMMEKNVKQNLFKQKLHQIDKIQLAC